MTDFDKGSNKVPNHPIKKAVPLERQLQNTALFFHDSYRSDIPHRRFSFIPRIGGECGKVVFPSKNLGGLAQRGEIERSRNVPRPSDLERVKRIGVGDPVKV